METAKPEANAYRIASAALERAETTYERLLWRQVRHEKLVESDGRSAALLLIGRVIVGIRYKYTAVSTT